MSRYALPLDAYDCASVWGHDGPDGYFAQLWRNDLADEDQPDIILNWFAEGQAILSALKLARQIAAATRIPVVGVAAAIAEAQDAPEHPLKLELADLLTSTDS